MTLSIVTNDISHSTLEAEAEKDPEIWSHPRGYLVRSCLKEGEGKGEEEETAEVPLAQWLLRTCHETKADSQVGLRKPTVSSCKLRKAL